MRGAGCGDVLGATIAGKRPRASSHLSSSEIVGARRVAEHEQHAHVLPSLWASRAAPQCSVGAEAEVLPGRTRLTASWALASWAFWSRALLHDGRGDSRGSVGATASHRVQRASFSGPTAASG